MVSIIDHNKRVFELTKMADNGRTQEEDKPLVMKVSKVGQIDIELLELGDIVLDSYSQAMPK